jgi:CRISPR-associated protein Cas8b/Csh1 subtype I-B
VGRPLDAGTKGDQLTPNSLENTLTSALEKAKVYAHDSDDAYHRNLLLPETVDKLLEQTEAMPTDWEIEKSELRFCYVLGHAHGRRSMPVAFTLSGENASEKESAQPAN